MTTFIYLWPIIKVHSDKKRHNRSLCNPKRAKRWFLLNRRIVTVKTKYSRSWCSISNGIVTKNGLQMPEVIFENSEWLWRLWILKTQVYFEFFSKNMFRIIDFIFELPYYIYWTFIYMCAVCFSFCCCCCSSYSSLSSILVKCNFTHPANYGY